MALELFSETWAGWPAAPCPAPGAASPRISFSRDLDSPTTLDHQHHQQRSDSSLLDSSSSPDFDFCVSRDRPEQEYSCAADELFSDGFLLPLPLLPTGGGTPSALPSLPTHTTTSSSSVSSNSSRPLRPLPTPRAEEKKDGVEVIAAESGSGAAADEKPVAGKQPSSFWRFGRSSSLNCSGSSGGGGGGARRASLICSLPLLSRSKSTGSNPSPPTLKQRQQPFNSTTTTAASSSSSKLSRKGSGNGGAAARNPYYYGQHHHSGGGGVRISPVLNVPPPYIPKGSGAGLFSLGHLLCSSRDRSRKKTQPHTPTWQSS